MKGKDYAWGTWTDAKIMPEEYEQLAGHLKKVLYFVRNSRSMNISSDTRKHFKVGDVFALKSTDKLFKEIKDRCDVVEMPTRMMVCTSREDFWTWVTNRSVDLWCAIPKPPL